MKLSIINTKSTRSVSCLMVLLLLTGVLVYMASCKKLIAIPPPVTSLSAQNVYSSDATAIAAVTGIYATLSNTTIYFSTALPSLSGLAALSADEFTLYSGATGTTQSLYYLNALNSEMGQDFWTQIYNLVYMADVAEVGLTGATGLTPVVQQQLLGEVQFDRAFCYFYLVNLYGDVPLVLTTNYTTNASLPRTSQAQVWNQIIQDLHNAAAILSTGYLDGSLTVADPNRIRPIKWAALAMLARAYLYTENWAGADSAATAVINSGLFSLVPLPLVPEVPSNVVPDSDAFSANSNEAIWQLQPVQVGWNTPDAQAFVLPPNGPNSYPNIAYLSNSLLNSFEANDQRRINWVDSITVGGVTYYYPYKYKSDSLGAPITEYTMVLRLGEQYLIRAEAEAELNNLTGADTDLNVIRSRAGLAGTAASTQSQLLAAIAHERQIELFSEWGHRWLDLKRTGTVDAVMGAPGGACAAKNGTWYSYDQWYPVPLYDLQWDPKLVQTKGY